MADSDPAAPHDVIAEWRVSPQELDFNFKNHAACEHEGKIYVFGGYDGNNNNNHIRIFDAQTLRAEGLLSTHGRIPNPRNGHSLTVVGHKVFLIGGWVGAGPLASDHVFALDLRTRVWEKFDASGEHPGPCNMHTATYFPSRDGLLVMRGGDGRLYLSDLHELSVGARSWRRVRATGAIPPPRANHTATRSGEYLVVFGGWNGVERFRDVRVLSTVSWVWTEVKQPEPPLRNRAGACSGVCGDYFVVFGGSGSRGRCFDDLDALHLPSATWLSTVRTADADVAEAQLEARRRKRRGGGGAAGGGEGKQADRPAILRAVGRVDELAERIEVYEGRPVDDDSPVLFAAGSHPGELSGHTGTVVDGALVVIGGSVAGRFSSRVYSLVIDPSPRIKCRTPHPLTASLSTGTESALAHFALSPDLADVEFLVQDERVPAHRVVLAAASDHFRALFGSGFREASESQIRIEDVRAEIFKLFVRYLYAGRVEVFDERLSDSSIATALELMVLADAYIVPNLKEQCEVYLKRAVDATTAADLLDRARVANALQLARYCAHVLSAKELDEGAGSAGK